MVLELRCKTCGNIIVENIEPGWSLQTVLAWHGWERVPNFGFRCNECLGAAVRTA